MSEYQLNEGLAHLSMDDGKVNALGTDTLTSLGEQLDQAEKDAAIAIVLSGREGKFSRDSIWPRFEIPKVQRPCDVSSSTSYSVSSSPTSLS